MKTRRGLQFVALVLAMILLAACSKTATPKSSGKPKVLTVGYGAEPGNMLPYGSGGEASVRANMFDSLVRRDRDLKLAPSLATSWETSQDGKTWTFHLRKNVKFHNGEPFNAQAVKWTFDTQTMGKTSVVKTQFTDVTEVKVVDDYTVQFVTKNQFPLLLNYLSSSFFAMPPKYYQEVGGDPGFDKKPIGTGPFKFVEWVKNERIVMEANPDYFLGRPKLDKVIFRPIPETATRLAELLSGGVDVIMQVPPEHVGTIKNSPNARVEMRNSVRVVFIGLRTDQKPFDDVRVRRAVNLAINKDELMKSVLAGQGYLTPGPLSPLVWGYDSSIKGYGYDVQQAKQLLADAGYPDGFSVTLETPVGRYLKDKEVSEWVAGELAKIGIKVTVKTFEWGQYLEKYRNHKYDTMYVLGWGGTAYDADFVFSNLFESSNFRSYYKVAEVDKKIAEARNLVDANKRLALYKELQEKIVSDAPWIFLYGQIDAWGLANRVNWSPGLTEYAWLWDADVK